MSLLFLSDLDYGLGGLLWKTIELIAELIVSGWKIRDCLRTGNGGRGLLLGLQFSWRVRISSFCVSPVYFALGN